MDSPHRGLWSRVSVVRFDYIKKQRKNKREEERGRDRSHVNSTRSSSLNSIVLSSAIGTSSIAITTSLTRSDLLACARGSSLYTRLPDIPSGICGGRYKNFYFFLFEKDVGFEINGRVVESIVLAK